jgi:diaminopimelate epimerase/ribosomal protein S18 acetylase RimI-like enzyme
MMQVKQISLLRPGGNDTALVPMSYQTYDQRQKSLINDAIMTKYTNIEQVGFIDLSNRSEPSLQMAGGEFCGNATRSTAFLSLEGQPGEVSIQVSGVNRRLRAGIDNKGNSWAEMPVSSANLETSGPYTLVPLEGITQVIAQKPKNIDQPEAIKKLGMEILNQLDLTNNPQVPAAGVMFINQKDQQIIADPVVWVRDIKTCFYETACGSGTAAVGLYLTRMSGNKQGSYSVRQPSGMIIEVTADLTNNAPEVFISGPVKVLDTNAFVEINRNLSLAKVNAEAEMETALSNGLITLYQEVFSQDPYNEYFEEAEVKAIFKDYLNNNGIVFVARDNERVVAFSAGEPLVKSSVSTVSQLKELPADSWYIADLGVLDSLRRQKMGTDLIQALLNTIGPGKLAVMRTAQNNFASQELFARLGFEKLSFTQEVSQTRTDNQEKSDQRIFMAKQL